MKEYDRIDAAFYDYYSGGVEGDVQFYVEEARKAGSPVLELGCGTGRILIPVGGGRRRDRRPGPRPVDAGDRPATRSAGLDRGGAAARSRWSRATCASFSLGQRFKLVTIPYRAFLHLLTDEDQRQALRCIRDHLAARRAPDPEHL